MKKLVIDPETLQFGTWNESDDPTPMMVDYKIIDWHPPREWWTDWEEVDRRTLDHAVTQAVEVHRTLFTAIVTKSHTWNPVRTTERRRKFAEWTDEQTGQRMCEQVDEEFRTYQA